MTRSAHAMLEMSMKNYYFDEKFIRFSLIQYIEWVTLNGSRVKIKKIVIMPFIAIN